MKGVIIEVASIEKRKHDRLRNLEQLRIVAMILIVLLHMFGKTLAIQELKTSQMVYYFAWFICIICGLGTNIFTMMSGYFYKETKFRIYKLLNLYIQVLFYSVFFAFFAKTCLNIELTSKWKEVLFPITSGEYWYITIYMAVYCLLPFIHNIIESISKEDFAKVLVIIFILLSFIPTIFNTENFLNAGGNNGICWFIFVYLLGAFIRKYDINIWQDKNWGVFVVLILVILVMSVYRFLMDYLKIKGFYRGYVPLNMDSSYMIAPLVATVLIFMLFKNMKQPRHWVGVIVDFFSKGCLGVYLIHNNRNIAHWIWENLKINYWLVERENLLMPLLLGIFVFIICNLIEHLRMWIFKVSYLDNLIVKFSDKIIMLAENVRKQEYK